jgi:hypothetical protein
LVEAERIRRFWNLQEKIIEKDDFLVPHSATSSMKATDGS